MPMSGDFESLLNNSLSQIYEKYKDIDDSLDNIVEIGLESSTPSEYSSEGNSFYGDEHENFSFIKNQRNPEKKKSDRHFLALDFCSLYNFLFHCETVEDILGMID